MIYICKNLVAAVRKRHHIILEGLNDIIIIIVHIFGSGRDRWERWGQLSESVVASQCKKMKLSRSLSLEAVWKQLEILLKGGNCYY